MVPAAVHAPEILEEARDRVGRQFPATGQVLVGEKLQGSHRSFSRAATSSRSCGRPLLRFMSIRSSMERIGTTQSGNRHRCCPLVLEIVGDDDVHLLRGVGGVVEVPGDKIPAGDVLVAQREDITGGDGQPGDQAEAGQRVPCCLQRRPGPVDGDVDVQRATDGPVQRDGVPADDSVAHAGRVEGGADPRQRRHTASICRLQRVALRAFLEGPQAVARQDVHHPVVHDGRAVDGGAQRVLADLLQLLAGSRSTTMSPSSSPRYTLPSAAKAEAQTAANVSCVQ